MNERIRLGRTDIEVSAVGIGTWQWGQRFYWGYGREYGEADVRAAFQAAVDGGIDFFDTAEVYGDGESERLLGRFVRESGARAVVATKFMPFPWRLRRGNLVRALRRSLGRLEMERVDLYMVHMPWPPRSVETWAGTLADAVEAGLARAVGVSNYNAARMRRAYDALERRGVRLASNQVEFNLLSRKPEREGLLDACRELGVTLIAYCPLAQGMLTGKYSAANPPPRLRRLIAHTRPSRSEPYVPDNLDSVLGLLREVGEAHGGKTQAQVALNWLMCKGALPIPGAKSASHAGSHAGALGWRLSDEEVALLDETSARV